MINKRVAAFTILEVTITMLVSAIVIAISYTAFSIISRSYHAFESKHQQMAFVLKLDELLQKDFNRADIILRDTDGIALRYSLGIIKYRFKPDYILRVGVETDTFKAQSDSLSTTFENTVINVSSTGEEENRVDALSFYLTLENEKIPYRYHKVYSSENLINRNHYAIH
jgi:hypothetical protein